MNEVEKKEIEEMAKIFCCEKICTPEQDCKKCEFNHNYFPCVVIKGLKLLKEAGYGKVEDCMKGIEHEDRELKRLKQSLSDCAYMTSSIGDLPINSVGLRRAVDEIARLQIVEAELQKLNAKYYNELKDSKRKIKKLKEILNSIY